MIGIKTNESEKFIKFFQIVQSEAQKQGCVYYLDAGDGRDYESDELSGEDLMGWLVPKELSAEFEKEWFEGDPSDEWSKYYTWAIWYAPDRLVIKFEQPNISEIGYKYILSRLLERAFESIEEADESKADFDKGRKLAYYEVADIIRSELLVRDGNLGEFGLDLDLEKKFH